ncbi:MAG: uroporphyrinogen decarboxylase family protein [Candidatus Korobacteraceae bacterium]|jgi:[methyl-Co(III) methanol-specific corrinoid protein]:coenzyme M methyltransferase
MLNVTPKERLLRVLNKESVDRPPVICTGGMMNAAIVDVMERSGHTLPAAHSDQGLMADLATDVAEATGFENLGIPFCMTVEAELLGSEIDMGTLACEPKIAREIFSSVKEVAYREVESMVHKGRLQTVKAATWRLVNDHPDLPVIASLTGPLSTAASIVEPMTFLKELRKNETEAHRVLAYITDLLVAFAREELAAGATAIAIGDPTATGEILGPDMFGAYAVPHLNDLVDRIHALGAPVILHICGQMKRVWHLLPELHADALSTDALVNLKTLKADFPQITTMGNLSTYLLQSGSSEQVSRRAKELVQGGIDIISPACGLSTSTALGNVFAMTSAVLEA